jgi:hypothetical protein
MTACDLPVRAEFKIMIAEARFIPLLKLEGKEEIHLAPATSKPAPIYAGNAMILWRG